MGGATAAVAAAAARARRRVISHFMSSNAVSADKAVPFTAEDRMEQRFFDRLRDDGVILPGTNGGYYLDPPAYDAYQQRKNKSAMFVLLAGVLVLVIGGALGFWFSRG
jgi:hypothetical protein